MSKLDQGGTPIRLINFQQARAQSDDDVTTLFLPGLLRFLPWRLQLVAALPWIVIRFLSLRPRAILCYGLDPVILGLALGLRRLTRIPVFHELTEYPDQVLGQSAYGKFARHFFERVFLPRAYGIFVISSALYRYVEQINSDLDIVLYPAIAEVAPRSTGHEKDLSSDVCFNAVYTGSLSEYKDGVLSLITAFAALHTARPNVRLTLLGHGTIDERERVAQLVSQLHLQDKVTLLDPVPHSEVAEFLEEADLLVLARPNSRQAEGGFPTKLAEYLASGTPVLVTATGDIEMYLNHGVNALVVPPDDRAAFSSALIKAFDSRRILPIIGKAGRELARNKFNPDRAAEIVAAWLRRGTGQASLAPHHDQSNRQGLARDDV